ncbi:M28 family peptidase [uncultured Aquimarina sp.]|uniref:M28 family metallopeptidase n=1 Tax=uncultured Aquimarina sp. TaxID=575652 RepID=UPI0026325EA1|nr:M28 family peptidase [uncultured Aquimarina sp.]
MNNLLKKLSIVSLLLTPFLSNSQNQLAAEKDITSIQMEILQKLTGKTPIKDKIYLNQRASPKERDITANYLSDYLSSMGWQLENHYYRTSNGNPLLDLCLPPVKGINVAAILPATTDSNEYLLFGGHYDSERNCPGAIDNATGVALSLAIAYKLAKLKKRNINFLIVLFDQEEDGEVGSKAYAKMLKKMNRKIHSVHTIDMMGWDKDQNYGIEIELPSKKLKNLYESNAKKYHIPIYSTTVSSSDHKSFIDEGFNTVGISEEYAKRDTTPFIHTPKDTYETINFDYLLSSTNFVFKIFKKLAQ